MSDRYVSRSGLYAMVFITMFTTCNNDSKLDSLTSKVNTLTRQVQEQSEQIQKQSYKINEFNDYHSQFDRSLPNLESTFSFKDGMSQEYVLIDGRPAVISVDNVPIQDYLNLNINPRYVEKEE